MVCFCLQGLSLRGNPLLVVAAWLQRVKPLFIHPPSITPMIAE
jgi:hypothetical protein